jgi:uncharacterized protein
VMRDQFTYSKGNTLQPRSTGGYQEMAGRITRYQHRATESAPDKPHRDIGLTRKWMDSIGVDVACIFPTPMLGLGLNPVVEVEVQYARAYNRWLTENILSQEPRMVSMLYLPMNDPVAALKMVEDFGDCKGVVGFLVTTVRYQSLHENRFMKVFAALEERGLPVAFHSGPTWSGQAFEALNRFLSVHALSFPFNAMIHLTNMVINGIPERFPGLKLIFMECGVTWLPFIATRLDTEYLMRPSEAPLLTRLPSEYISEFHYTSQPLERATPEHLRVAFDLIKAETQLLYASDYPHQDFDLPTTIADLRFVSDEGRRRILGANAAELFGLADIKLQDRPEIASLPGRAP